LGEILKNLTIVKEKKLGINRYRLECVLTVFDSYSKATNKKALEILRESKERL